MSGEMSVSTADLVILAVIGQQALSGLRTGLVMGVFQLVVLIAGVVLALAFEEPVAAMLEGVVPLDPGMRRLATYVVITTAAGFAFGIVGARILGPLMARQGRSRATTVVDRALGVLPAAVRGVVYAGSIVYMARIALPEGHDIREQLDASTLAPLVQRIFEAVTPFARVL